jgi:hypothetical protein
LVGKRFGPPDADVERRLGQLSGEQLDELAEALLDFNSRAELAAWLDARSGAAP